MSTKNTGTDEKLDFEKNVKAETPSQTVGTGDTKEAEDRPMGLIRFLQCCPQESGITALLRSKHFEAVYTKRQWEIVIADLLHKKVQ